jgi:alpha-glucosidase
MRATRVRWCGLPDPWWADAVVYQIYPRSFQDADGDGIGDLPGIAQRLDELAALGVDALWLSPMYPSPLADGGYDVTDFTGVDPRLGTVHDVVGLADAAHARGMRLLLDLVPNHTSIEHPWFREHPDWYIWADAPANNWRAAFGGSVWTRDERTGRFYLHSFFEEQPDLDWRNPAVAAAMQDVVRTWLRRGVDGFRLDALDCLGKHPDLRDDPPATGPPPFPEPPDAEALERRHSRSWTPAVGPALGALRSAAGDAFLVGEVYRPTAELGPYLAHLDCAFVFELLFSEWRVDAVGDVIAGAACLDRPAWVLSNHDFGRFGSRVSAAQQPAAAMLLLTLPGAVFLYQGDEIGLLDGPGGDPPHDRYNRDRARHPMQWDSSPAGGFTAGTPWLPAVDPATRNVADERRDPASLWSLHRDLIRLRRGLRGPLEPVAGDADGLLAYRRGDVLVALNLGTADIGVVGTSRVGQLTESAEVLIATPGVGGGGRIPPGGGIILRLS